MPHSPRMHNGQLWLLNTGACVNWFRIDGKIGEVYDVEILPGAVCPMAVPPMSDEAASLITYDGMPGVVDNAPSAPSSSPQTPC